MSGKHSFVPSGEPIIHGVGDPAGAVAKPRTPEPIDRYCSEKITELAMLQNELTRVTRERDGLEKAMAFMARHDGSDLAPAHRAIVKMARETLAKLARGELRKPGV